MGWRNARAKNSADGCSDKRRPSTERAAKKSGKSIETFDDSTRVVRRGYREDCAVKKAEDQSVGMKRSRLRGIPSVDKLAQALRDTGLPFPAIVAAVRRELAALRKNEKIPGFEEILSRLHSSLAILSASRLQPVINGTGILVHTNFGRAPLGRAVMEAVSRIGMQYNNLEFGLAEGARGGRAAYLEHNLAILCGAEAATVVNNNASALVLILRHFCKNESPAAVGLRKSRRDLNLPRKNQVVISRGELVQIGGGFR